jgi:DNA invertase Pin-like site-specific DNA recombinase
MSKQNSVRVVSYIRVSTQKQGQSGLGLEAQQAAVEAFCRDNSYELLDSFVEVESGRKKDRPILRKALGRAKATKSLFLVAKLDRLSRNVAFIATLMDSGVEFRACDVPSANRLLLHILSAVAEEEARAISTRTRAALAAAKARGTKLGAHNEACHRITRSQARKGAQATSRAASEANREATTIALALRNKGLSYPAIAAELVERGIFSRKGGSWTAMQVWRLLQRAA